MVKLPGEVLLMVVLEEHLRLAEHPALHLEPNKE